MLTRHHWTKEILDAAHRPRASQMNYNGHLSATKLEETGFGRTWRGMGSTRLERAWRRREGGGGGAVGVLCPQIYLLIFLSSFARGHISVRILKTVHLDQYEHKIQRQNLSRYIAKTFAQHGQLHSKRQTTAHCRRDSRSLRKFIRNYFHPSAQMRN